MPKKFTGENTKSAQARARKDAVRKDEQERKLKEAEDKLWEDNDKHVLRKQERKEEKDKKQAEKLLKKQETEKLLAEELKTLKSAKPDKPVEKVSKFEIDKMKEREAAAAAAAEAARLAGNLLIKIDQLSHLYAYSLFYICLKHNEKLTKILILTSWLRTWIESKSKAP